jgi:hypothetical protein
MSRKTKKKTKTVKRQIRTLEARDLMNATGGACQARPGDPTSPLLGFPGHGVGGAPIPGAPTNPLLGFPGHGVGKKTSPLASYGPGQEPWITHRYSVD